MPALLPNPTGLKIHQPTDYDRIIAMRLAMAPEHDYVDDDGEDGAPVRQHGVATTESTGIIFQRCGGGRRVIRKRIGSA